MADANKKVDDANGRVGDLEATNKKLANQKAEVEKQHQEAEAQLSSMEKIKDQLKKELEDTKGLVTHETQVRFCRLMLRFVTEHNNLCLSGATGSTE